jgi:hypothetical protein
MNHSGAGAVQAGIRGGKVMISASQHKEHPPVPAPGQPVEPDRSDTPAAPVTPKQPDAPGEETVRRN